MVENQLEFKIIVINLSIGFLPSGYTLKKEVRFAIYISLYHENIMLKGIIGNLKIIMNEHHVCVNFYHCSVNSSREYAIVYTIQLHLLFIFCILQDYL